MPSVLDRSALEQSPLADLHLLANELGVDGFRRLRKPELVDAILARQGGGEAAEEPAAAEAPAEEGPKRSRRGRRGGRGRRRDEDDGALVDRDEPAAAAPSDDREEKVVEGVVELLANGSGFLRLSPPEETDQDVYISAAQVKRCELVSGDRISGPVRPARRSERFPSLIRVATINGRPAEEVAEGTRFEDLPVAWPDERIELGSEDETVRAIEWLTPFGKGSRVIISGPSRSGKSEALRRIAAALAGRSGLEVSVVLAGVRPEEAVDYPVAPSAVLTFAASSDAQAQAVEQAVETGRRVAARGGDAVVLIDGFEYLPVGAARRALAAGRNLRDGGSLTVIATAPAPIGGETTVIALERSATFPSLSLRESGVLRPELLVGEAGAEALRAALAGGEVKPPALPAPEPAEEPAAAKPKAKGKAAAKKPAAKKPAAAKTAAAKKPAAKKAAAAKTAAAKKPAAKSAAARKPASAKTAAAKKPAAAKTAAKKPAAAKPAANKPAAKRKAAAKKSS